MNVSQGFLPKPVMKPKDFPSLSIEKSYKGGVQDEKAYGLEPWVAHSLVLAGCLGSRVEKDYPAAIMVDGAVYYVSVAAPAEEVDEESIMEASRRIQIPSQSGQPV